MPKSTISSAGIQASAKQLLNTINNKPENEGLFTVKTANMWIEQAKLRPAPEMLYDCLWYEGELCILFADTNLGKSILAVQIADSISTGVNINGFQLSALKQPVLYFDFELSDKQFEIRYSKELVNHYSFNDNFLRVEINQDADMPEDITFENFLNESLEKSIISTGAKILIIDNITYLKTENEKAKDALSLMKHLKKLKSKYQLSILALAHTPKRDSSKPLTKNDLQGSKMLINFCDSSFAIGESFKDSNVRYIKQIKQRNKEEMFGTGNIIICQIVKPDNFLHFDFIGHDSEYNHLKVYTEKDKTNTIQMVKDLSAQGKSQRQISSELNIGLGTVNNYLKK